MRNSLLSEQSLLMSVVGATVVSFNSALVQAVDFADTEHFTEFAEFFREHRKTRSP